MWPFSKKQPETERVEDQIVIRFPMGSKIEYLGVDMVITGHYRWDGGCGHMSGLETNYVDGKGVIRTHWFCQREVYNLFMTNQCQP